MKITEVRAFPVGVALDEPLRWGAMKVEVKGGILVRVSTDEGVEGIGEAGFSAEYFATVGPIINDQLGPEEAILCVRCVEAAPIQAQTPRQEQLYGEKRPAGRSQLCNHYTFYTAYSWRFTCGKLAFTSL